MKPYELEKWSIDESNLIKFCCTDDPFMDDSGDDGCSIDEPISQYDDSFENTLQKLFVSDKKIASAHIRAFLARFDVSSMACEMEGRKEANSDCAVPIQKELLLNSRFTESEILLQQLACKLACTESELSQLIDLFESPRFHSDEVGMDLTRKVAARLSFQFPSCSLFTCFHMFSYVFICFHMFSYIFIYFQIKKVVDCSKLIKVPLHKENDGIQDLNLFMRDPLEVLQELIGDVKASGKQYYAFQEYKNEQGERVFYHTNGTLWWQRAQERALELGGPNTGVLSVIFSMDATFVKKNTYFRPLYSMYFICFHMFSHVFICFHKYFFQFLLAISWWM
jgi:hypothetical protein